jgi:hypothetical protein
MDRLVLSWLYVCTVTTLIMIILLLLLAPRDLVLVRYWRHSSDGCYVICLDSTEHRECPLIPGVVRYDDIDVIVICL